MEGATAPKKPTFMQIFIDSQLGVHMCHTLSKLANVPCKTVYLIILGKPVAKDEAERILTIMSQFIGSILTLENVSVPLLKEEIRHE